MAKTGKEALDYLKAQPVDVIFTDINMPVIDGLEVLQYVSENQPETVSVVISGYQDFHYAQKALQCGVKNYLVKPVDKKELAGLLQEIRDAHGGRERERKRRILQRELYGNYGEPEEGLTFDPIYPLYLVAKAYCIHSLEEEAADLDIWKGSRLIEAEKLAGPAAGNIYTLYGRNPNEIMILLEARQAPDLKYLAEKILEENASGLPVAVAAGSAVTDLSCLREEIGKLRIRIYHNWVYGESQMVEERGGSLFHLPESVADALQYALKNKQMKEFEKLLSGIRDQMRKERITQDQMEKVLNKILLCVWATQNASIDSIWGSMRYDINDVVVRARDLDGIFEEFRLWCRKLVLPEEKEDAGTLMQRLDDYIQAHYQEPINTKLLAGKFGLVPPYLSKLFQKYKGLSPNHYIQKIRLEKAEGLLKTCPELMTKDVASMTGYTDPGYFSKAFKKWTGMYPSEYRAACAKRDT